MSKKPVKKKAPRQPASRLAAIKLHDPCPPYRGPQPGCPSCGFDGRGLITLDINTVRHWLLSVELGDADDPRLSNKLNRRDFESYFSPLVFVGWHRITPDWQHVLSPLKKDSSNTFVFQGKLKSGQLTDLARFLKAGKQVVKSERVARLIKDQA